MSVTMRYHFLTSVAIAEPFPPLQPKAKAKAKAKPKSKPKPKPKP